MRIRDVREQQGISQKELALALGIAPNTLSQYENEKRAPDYDTIIRIADYFRVSVDYLLGRVEKEKPAPKDGGGQDDPMRSTLLRNFDQLNRESRERLVVTSDDMVSSGKYIKSDSAGLGKTQRA